MATIEDARQKELFECFAQIDKDGDGTIARRDLFTIFRMLGQYPEELTIEKLCELMDPLESGNIGKEPFLEHMVKFDEEKKKLGRLEETFHLMDKGRTGDIDLAEIIMNMKSLGEDISEKDAEQMIKNLDTNNDGKINLEEFLAMLNK